MAMVNGAAAPTFGEAFATFWRIGILSFGGPTAQIAVMHRILVDEKGWLTERQFLNALSFCMLLPGPEAMQLATYAGWRLHGVAGGLAAGLLFVLPGAAVVLALAMIYAGFGEVRFVEALFLGIKAAVLVIVVEALLRISKKALKGSVHWVLAGLSFLGIFVFALPFPLIIAIAALLGYMHGDRTGEDAGERPELVKASRTFGTILIWTAIWMVPLVGLAMLVGHDHILAQLGVFFSKLAMVTFGGAYAVLAYMAQDVVVKFGWLEAGQMMDGLGLAETTPGPLILVTEFVGYLAAYRQGGDGALMLGVAGALVTLWATFAPCFLWIFAGAPYIDWIIARPRLRGALSAITAAVVGVILNLAVWFALHVFFAEVSRVEAAGLTLWVPEWATLDWRVVAMSAISGWLLLVRHWGIAKVLGVAAVLGLAFSYLPV
ncbi:MAG: chromate efflux transporter [Rhodospirillales bacterium]